MTAVLQGTRIVEVSEHAFVPSATAILAAWGADVIKIEHVERGDAMRGLASSGVAGLPSDVHALLEHCNRGKRSIGLDLASPDGLDILYKIAAKSDVFVTNKVPSVRERLNIDLDQIRAHNPDIIYVRGTGQGEHGPDADRGSYDALAYWARAGVAMSAQRPEYDLVPVPPAPGFGDSIGGMTIAGGIMGALLHRDRTGEATVVDVSLLSVGLWSMGLGVALSLSLEVPWAPPPDDQIGMNPLARTYTTKDGRLLWFMCLQADKYWPSVCAAIGRPELAEDERFSDHASLTANNQVATEMLEAAFASATLEEWVERLESFTGQWAVVQNTIEAANDPQSVANDYVQQFETSAGAPFRLVAPPVRYDDTAPEPRRAPEFNEHGDEILAELGLDWDTIMDLKVRGVVA